MIAQRSPVRVLFLLVAAATLPFLLLAATAGAQTTGTEVGEPASFTSTFSVRASGEEVPQQDDGSRGEPGATGTFNLRVAASEGIICHDITLTGVTPPFESPAPTATHIHDGPTGVAGPAVWLFPNPEMSADGTLQTSGCLQEAFTADGASAGFALADIEATPSTYYVDNHTTAFVPGAVRGQFPASAAPSGGVAAGAGGTAGGGPWIAVAAAATALSALGLLAHGVVRRRSAAS